MGRGWPVWTESVDGVDADSSSEVGAEAFSLSLLLLEGFVGWPLCLHSCLVLNVLLILFFPVTCPFLPENHHTVQDQLGSSVHHSELFSFSN